MPRRRTPKEVVGLKLKTWTVEAELPGPDRKLKVVCECGYVTFPPAHRFFGAARQKYGCQRCSPKVRRAENHPRFQGPGHAGINYYLRTLRKNASARGLELALTDDQALAISKMDCTFCGEPPTKPWGWSRSGIVLLNGIDRWDNDVGYTTENALPCCHFCNYAKRTLSGQEFMQRIERFFQWVDPDAVISFPLATHRRVWVRPT